MSERGDAVERANGAVERAADKLAETAERAGERGGLAGRLARPLSEDAAFLRKLKPSLIAARARGETPAEDLAAAPSGPQVRAQPRARRTGGPNPFAGVGAAFAAGAFLAKLVDWRSHAHPRQ